MKQVIQSYKTGKVELIELPIPFYSANQILVQNQCSLVSLGTEKLTIELGQKSLVGKAKARPDLVRRALVKAKSQGFIKTYQEAISRLDQPTPLGYSCAGVVVETGIDASCFTPGDRVACYGQGYASHAEYVRIPINLACKLPGNVSFEHASFAMLGAIALHGIHKANLTFGSVVCVIGLGLLGLLTVQLLKAYGCRVIATDLVTTRNDLALQLGAEFATNDPDRLKRYIQTHSFGMDAAILTIASKSAQPVQLALETVREQAKIVVVGVADLHVDRNDMWQKEAELVVSKAAGAGSLDPIYEKDGIDLPLAESRWTQKRNVQEFLRLVSERKINLEQIITHRFDISQAKQVYNDIIEQKEADPIGIIFQYPKLIDAAKQINLKTLTYDCYTKPFISVIGAGLFAKSILLPELIKHKSIQLNTLVTQQGMNCERYARKFGFEIAATDYRHLFDTTKPNHALIILTPHSTHANLLLKCLHTAKACLIEKPLCVDESELVKIYDIYHNLAVKPIIMVGHNRRYSPHITEIKNNLKRYQQYPCQIQIRVNAGFVEQDHWVHHKEQGRSRIVGEMSHFIDLFCYLIDSIPMRVYAERISGNNVELINNDNIIVTIKFHNGSIATLYYTASGFKNISREQLTIDCMGDTIILDDFNKTTYYVKGKQSHFKTARQALGYQEELSYFISCITNNKISPPDFYQQLMIMNTVFAIEKSLATAKPQTVELSVVKTKRAISENVAQTCE